MREIVHLQAGQCGNQIGSKVKKKSINQPIGRLYCGKKNLALGKVLAVFSVFISNEISKNTVQTLEKSFSI
jgi:hypothetical protein